MSFTIGILQGRLSPSLDGRFQFFPSDWAAEFPIAKAMGFSGIEWMFDFVDYDKDPNLNPVLSANGRAQMKQAAAAHGLAIHSICADYFMKYRMDGAPADVAPHAAVLERLIDAAAETAQRLLLVPILEKNAPKTEKEKNAIAANMRACVARAEELGVRIGFENEMPVDELSEFLDRFRSDAVGAYYDIGNCTSYGFNCSKDILRLGKRVFGIHAKDRRVHTTQSVTLGTGDADYGGCFAALRTIGFSGAVIMQAWRGVDYLKDAREQLLFLQSFG